MIRTSRSLLAVAAALLLAGCASSGGGRAAGARPAAVERPSVPVPTSGRTGAVIGRTAAAVIGLLGQPALDVREGSGRKLQFMGRDCVLDAYLYPPGGRGEPVVTHVDARHPDGRDAAREACIAALRQR